MDDGKAPSPSRQSRVRKSWSWGWAAAVTSSPPTPSPACSTRGSRYRGCFSLDPMLPVLRRLGGPLNPRRTPRIILAAAEGRLALTADGRARVPRGRKPTVPHDWLTHGYVTPRPAPP
jgi:hypothetical protein